MAWSLLAGCGGGFTVAHDDPAAGPAWVRLDDLKPILLLPSQQTTFVLAPGRHRVNVIQKRTNLSIWSNDPEGIWFYFESEGQLNLLPEQPGSRQ